MQNIGHPWFDILLDVEVTWYCTSFIDFVIQDGTSLTLTCAAGLPASGASLNNGDEEGTDLPVTVFFVIVRHFRLLDFFLESYNLHR